MRKQTRTHRPDFTVSNHSSIILVTPLTRRANDWISEHIPDDAQWFAGGVAVEPRYIDDIIYGLEADGLTQRGAFILSQEVR